jgi:hypothetical protein
MTTRPEQDVKAEADLATHAAKTPSQAHATDATLEKVANKGQSGGYAGLDANARLTSAVERLLPAPSGSDDLAAINAVLAAGGFVRGRPDQTYLISGPLVVPSNTRLDMKRCTVQFANTSVRTNMLQNAAVAPVATATDVTTTAGSAVVVSATLAAVAQVGQVLAVVGAGPQGGDVANGAGNIWLYGTVLSVAGSNITLTSNNKNGIAANSSGSGRTGYLFNRDSNITLVGGVWDGGTNWNVLADRQAAGFNSHQLRLRRVDGLTLEGEPQVKLSGFPAGGGYVFGIALGDCTDVHAPDIAAAGASTTIQVDGPLHRMRVGTVRGQTQDDMVALGAVGFQGGDCEGDITDVEIDCIQANGSWTGFKAFAGTGSNGVQRYVDATVRAVKGSTVRAPVNLVDYAGAGAGPINVRAEDVTATPGAGFSAIVNSATYGQLIEPSTRFSPRDINLLHVSCDPLEVGGTLQPSAGFIYLAMLKAPQTLTVANLLAYVITAGATLTSGQCLGGIWDSNGNLWAATADQSAVWNSTGPKTMALTAQGGRSLTLPGGSGVFYWAGLLVNGTTSPFFAARTGQLTPFGFVSGASVIPGAKQRAAFTSVGGRTSLGSLNGASISDGLLKSMLLLGTN